VEAEDTHMNGIVVRKVSRPARAEVEKLARFGSATVHEAQGRTGLMQPWLRPVWPGASICGTAVTVSAHPGDNWMLHVVAELVQPGDVVVVALPTISTDGMFGDLLATSYQSRGVLGLVIEAGCRDVKTLQEMKFPVWSRAISARGTVKATPGSVNIPIVCGGEAVNPGDVIVADDDGIVVVPAATLAGVAAASAAREKKEETNRKRLAAGELGLDIYGMRPKLEEAGLRYVDSLDDLKK
jgi:4-hydroxy-4-methyl-2-oxoglutarate aldolase